MFATRAEFKLLSCIMHSEKVKQTTSEKLVRRSSKIDRMLIASNPKNRSSRRNFIPRFNPRVFVLDSYNNFLIQKIDKKEKSIFIAKFSSSNEFLDTNGYNKYKERKKERKYT